MSFSTQQEAEAAGFIFHHNIPGKQYELLHTANGSEQLVGLCHYSLIGSDTLTFDHTVVSSTLRGTGLGGLLVQYALLQRKGDFADRPRTLASCSFVQRFL